MTTETPKIKNNQKRKRKSLLTNLKGRQLGDLTVLRIMPGRHQGKRMWMCRCSCGTELAVRHDYLLHTNSPKTHCGCKNRGLPTQHSSEYHIYNSMLRRCSHVDHVSYPYYGGRGICVCVAWQNSFEQFLNDVGLRPSARHTLDRIDPNGNYEPGNVRWATPIEQARNKRGTIHLPHPKTGLPVPASEVAEFLGLSYQGMRASYIKQGKWPLNNVAKEKLDKYS